ncbi:MAG TPA: tetratricopeptide repeat protein [Kofleriaceae bacterium]
MIRTLLVVALGVCPAVVAHADEASAKSLYEQGERAYNLGQFPKAIELFTQAYEASPKPAFLFNIAQTYRQAGDCKQSLFFYKRYLALAENDPKKPIKPELKAEVEKRITELDDCLKREIANKPPDSLDNGSGSTTSTTPTKPKDQGTSTTITAQTEDGEEDTGEEEEEQEVPPGSELPVLVSLRAIAGVAKLSAGSLDTKFQFAGTILGGYPLALGPKLALDLGAAFSFTPVPYRTSSNEQGSGTLIGVLANASPSYVVIPKLSVRGDVGAGVLVFAGLGTAGNPFTMMGTPATGPLSTFMARVAVSADYAITPNLIVTVTPFAFTYSPPPSGFEDSISSLTTMSFLAGIGYRR